MGSRSRAGASHQGKKKAARGKTAHHQENQTGSTGGVAQVAAEQQAGHIVDGVRVPPCATRLFQSTQYIEVEECCSDIRFFALKPRTHAQLKRCGVPVKLAEILLFQDVIDPTATATEGASDADRVERVHKGAVYAHIAAAEALRNLISNDDTTTTTATPSPRSPGLEEASGSIIALLTASDAGFGADGRAVDVSASSTSFSVRLALKLQRVWRLVMQERRTLNPAEWIAEQEQEAQAMAAEDDDETSAAAAEQGGEDRHAPRDSRTTGNAYLVLLRLLEELLLLTCLCVDGSETTADVFAALPGLLSDVLLSVLQSAMQTVWSNLQHPAGYFRAPPEKGSHEGSDVSQNAWVAAMRFMKQEETKGLGRVAVAAADLLRTLTDESETIAVALLLSGGEGATPTGATPEQLAFLNEAVDATALLAWLQSFSNGSHNGGFDTSALCFDEKSVCFQLIQTFLHIQGALVNATSASTAQRLARAQGQGGSHYSKHVSSAMDAAAAAVRRVLPLLCAVMHELLPLRVWSSVLPLLTKDESLLAAAYAIYADEASAGGSPTLGRESAFLTFLFSLYAQQLQARGADEEEEGNASGEDFLLAEGARASAVGMCTAQLRCTQVATKVFHGLVTFTCEQNGVVSGSANRPRGSHGGGDGDDDDDETAFRANPLSRVLFEPQSVGSTGGSVMNALSVFGALLKDQLWMTRGGGEGSKVANSAAASPMTDVMAATTAVVGGATAAILADPQQVATGTAARRQALHQQEKKLLTTFTDENAEVTTIQLILLSTEVAVLQTASTLLMMLPVESVGVPNSLWRALVQQVQERHQLLVTLATLSSNNNDDGVGDQESGGGGEWGQAAAGATIVSPAVQQLLWMHLEPLTATLWTILRKNQKLLQQSQQQQVAGHVVDRLVHPLPTDVDLLIRVFWERDAEVSIRQGCVASVGLLCAAANTVEATTAGARFALAVLANGRSPQLDHMEHVYFGHESGTGGNEDDATSRTRRSSVMHLGRGIVANSTAPPTNPQERRRWLALLSAVDGVVSLRCEAANALVDLFIDERFDTSVYVPLEVHGALSAFQPPLKMYIKKRLQLGKEMRRHYNVVLDCETEAEQWAEVEENLVGFLQYKAANVRM